MSANLDALENMFNSIGFALSNNAKNDLSFSLRNNSDINKHFAFLLDLKTNKILCYDLNVYLKAAVFPFSIHAEIQVITKYYRSSKSVNKNKKALLVVKISKTGVLSNSRCCLNCMRFIRNNFENLNLKAVYYSANMRELTKLSRRDLIDEAFKHSKGYQKRKDETKS